MCYCPTPTLHLNLALTGDCAFQLSPKKPHSVWFISVWKVGTWVNVLKSHLHLVIPVSLYKSMSWFVTKTRTHTHTHTHTHTQRERESWDLDPCLIAKGNITASATDKAISHGEYINITGPMSQSRINALCSEENNDMYQPQQCTATSKYALKILA